MSKIERALRKAEEDRQKKGMGSFPKAETVEREFVPTVSVESKLIHPAIPDLSECFRKIAARTKSCCENMGVRDVLFTSAVSGEGKSTVAANCAISLSQDFNLSVCLVDFDMRHPSLSQFFTSTNGAGIVDVLRGRVEVPSIIQATSVRNLSVVHSQKLGRASLPLLSNERMGRVIHELKSRFDFVVFDSPPILPVADAAVLSKHVSAIVLIIEPGRTRRKHIEQILEQVDRTKIVGFIMNYKQSRIPQTYNYRKYYEYEREPGALPAPGG